MTPIEVVQAFDINLLLILLMEVFTFRDLVADIICHYQHYTLTMY